MPLRSKGKAPSGYGGNPNVTYGDQSGAVNINNGHRREEANVDSTAGLRNKSWFVGAMPRKEVDIIICSKGAVGDWVVRESESQKGALVLVFRPVQPPGKNNVVLSKRIKFHSGMYCFENETKAYTTIEGMIKNDPVAKRAAGDLFGRGQPQPQPQRQQQPQQRRTSGQGRQNSGDGRTKSSYVESEDFGGFDEVQTPPAKAKPKRPKPQQQQQPQPSESFDDFGFDSPGEKKTPVKSAPARRSIKKSESFGGFGDNGEQEGFEVVVQKKTELTERLGMKGTLTCIVQSNKKLVLNGGSLQAPLSWVLTHMRRYGRESELFYFEAGRRCAPNGPGMVYLKTSDCDAIFDKVDAQVKVARAELKKQKEDETRVIQQAQARVKALEVAEDLKRKAAMEKHKKAAEAEARQRIDDERQKQEQLKREREATEKKAEEEAAAAAKKRAEKMKAGMIKKESIYESVGEIMKNAEKLEVSKQTEKKLVVKEQKDKYAGMFTAPKTEEPKHSKIWLALNPQPLAYQSIADRRDADEEKVTVTLGGQRDFNMMRNIMNEKAEETPNIDEEDEDYQEDPFSDNVACNAGDLEEMDEEDEEEDEDYDPDAYEEEDLVNDDVQDTMAMLMKMRAKRDEEEQKNKAALRAKFAEEKRIQQEALDKELAIIAAKKAIEDAAKEVKKEAAVKEALARMETELSFDFTFG